MKVIEDYLKKDLRQPNLASWEEIRSAYLARAAKLVICDYQSPSYLTSQEALAGRREGAIMGNINDYTRDQHDLSRAYEKKFASEYLPKQLLVPLEPYVTSSGMAALSTVIAMLHRKHGVSQTIMVGKHSYFQNLEALSNSFVNVIIFDEIDELEWQRTIKKEQPLAVFVDSMCNEGELTAPPIFRIAAWMKNNVKKESYLVLDNSMVATAFPFRKLLGYKSLKLNIVVWESLNKYYQFGMDRTTGGIVWGNFKLSMKMLHARFHAGTILSDIQTAMLPTPNYRVMKQYLERIENNALLMQGLLAEMVSKKRVKEVIRAQTEYGFNGAQIVIEFVKNPAYEQIQKMIKKMIIKARREGIQLAAGTSFGMPNTRVYLTARQTGFAKMFLRISVGTEETETIERLAEVIASSL
jgi:cystathionine beta-lyase/cystathionine gamma-synthase